MDITYETLSIFLILIPGFVSSLVLNAVIVRTDKSNLGYIIEALVFSFVIYVLISPFSAGQLVSFSSVTTGTETTYEISVSAGVLIATAVLSIMLPLGIGFLITNDLHMRLLRKLHITDKTARHTTWLDVFLDQKNRLVVVNLSDGHQLVGWPLYYANDPKEGSVYLYQPQWIGEDGELIKMEAHGIFIVKKDLIESIVFLENEDQ